MYNNIKITVNEKELEIKKNSTLSSLLDFGIPYKKGTAIGIFKKNSKKKIDISIEYKIITTKGEFKIRLYPNNSFSIFFWIKNYTQYKNMPIQWSDKNAISFRAISAQLDLEELKQEKYTYDFIDLNRLDVFFGSKHEQIIFSKTKHNSNYGISKDGAFAKVISGKNTLFSLTEEDEIISIEPIKNIDLIEEGFCTIDLNTPIEDGYKIFTHFEISVLNDAPKGAEHLYSLLKDDVFKIDFAPNSFISDYSMQGEICEFENFEPREVGSVYVRTVGAGTGKIYISKKGSASSIMHSIIGKVSKGMELIKIAQKGQNLFVTVNPPQIMLLGKSLKEVEKQKDINVTITKEGYIKDDAIVVEQSPDTTIEIINSGKLKIELVPKTHILNIELYYNDAPNTINFFKHSTNIHTKPIGFLELEMNYDTTYLFKSLKQAEKYKEILPENTPIDEVKAGEIGVTNQAAKITGAIGIRLEEDDFFGPTGEKFSSTNIIGRVLNMEILKDKKEGDRIYIRECL